MRATIKRERQIMSRPNILYIHSHDTGRYVQPYGYPVSTPAIQGLAEEGVVFRQAFCVGPTCSPSRAGLLTGQCAHSSGMIGLAHRGFSLNDYSQHIVHTLRGAGYSSTLIGVQHVADKAERIGYDRVVPLPKTEAEFVAPAAVNFLRNAPEQPFFLSVGFDETHRVFHNPGESEDSRYIRPPAPLPDTPETRQDMAAFKASARVLDDGMGAVFRALDESGLAGNTLVICTTDHGLAFPAMKCNLTDHGIGVMLIMRGPGGFTGGRVLDTMISHVDVFPTVCDLLGIEPPAWLQGRSFMPVIRGETDEINDEVYAGVTYHAAYEPQRCVRTRRWKYIRRYGERATPVLPNCDDSPSKDVWMAHGLRGRVVAAEQLYDVIFDPNEAHNLAGDPAMEPVLADMRARLNAWMQRTDDPLLHGPVAAPAGAVVNDPAGTSPQEPVQPA
jgi:arylsulfatase A-like enzyme